MSTSRWKTRTPAERHHGGPAAGPALGRRAARALLVGALMACASAPAALAQETEAVPPQDPLFETLFPPELIMQHRRAIGLTDEQRDAISQLIQELQGRVVRLQWELLDEMQQLTTIVEGLRVDLDRSLDQLDAVLDTEKEIKQAHLEMLIRIKNLLSAEQQATLERLRDAGNDG
jgi:Spy/CpxP family protein refolding chaperone